MKTVKMYMILRRLEKEEIFKEEVGHRCWLNIPLVQEKLGKEITGEGWKYVYQGWCKKDVYKYVRPFASLILGSNEKMEEIK